MTFRKRSSSIGSGVPDAGREMMENRPMINRRRRVGMVGVSKPKEGKELVLWRHDVGLFNWLRKSLC